MASGVLGLCVRGCTSLSGPNPGKSFRPNAEIRSQLGQATDLEQTRAYKSNTQIASHLIYGKRTVIYAISLFLFLLDKFDTGMCYNRTAAGIDPCDETSDEEDLSLYLWVFIAGRVLHGIGAVPLYTVCVTFLDDTVTKETFSFYIGETYFKLSLTSVHVC